MKEEPVVPTSSFAVVEVSDTKKKSLEILFKEKNQMLETFKEIQK